MPYLVIGSGRGVGNGYFYDPMDVDVGNDAVFVVDSYRGRIQKFNLKGEYLETFGSAGEDSPGLLDEPLSVAFRVIDENRSLLYVADTKNYRIQTYWTYVNGSEIKNNWTAFGEQLLDEYLPYYHIYLDKPSGVDVDSEGVLYVSNTGMDRISMFAQPLNYSKVPGPKNRTEFDGAASVDGPLNAPQGVAAYNGKVYVADTGNNMIRLFWKNGTQIMSFGKHGSGRGEFSSPRSLSVDAAGNIYVADTGNNRVGIYTSEGMYIAQFGTGNCSTSISSKPLLAAGQFCSPAGIDVKDGSIYVVDSGNHRLQVFNATNLPEPSCMQSGDEEPCGQVSLIEVIAYVNKWAVGDAELSDVIALINKWFSG